MAGESFWAQTNTGGGGEMVVLHTDYAALASELAATRAVLGEVVKAVEPLGIQNLVRAWNGDGDKPREQHPPGLGVTIKTNCRTCYEIDAAIATASLPSHANPLAGVELDDALSGTEFTRHAKKAKHYRVPGPYRVVFRQSFAGRGGRVCLGPAHIMKGDREVLGGFSGHEAGRICRALNLEAISAADGGTR